MRYTFTVNVVVEHVRGKFTSREDIAAHIRHALEAADPVWYPLSGASYLTNEWGVQELPEPSRRELARKRRLARAQKFGPAALAGGRPFGKEG